MLRITAVTSACLLLGASMGFGDDVWLQDASYIYIQVGADSFVVVFNVTYFDQETGDPIQHFQPPLNISGEQRKDDVHAELFLDEAGFRHVIYTCDDLDNPPVQWFPYYEVRNEQGWRVIHDQAGWVDDAWPWNRPTVYPSFAQDSEENVHIVWMDDRHGNWEIYYSKVYPDTFYQVIDDLTEPDIPISSIDGQTSGRFVDPLYVPGVEGLRLGCTSAPERKMAVTLPEEVWPSISIPYREKPRIAVDANDDVHIVWSERVKVKGPWVTKISPDGAAVRTNRHPLWAVYYSKLNKNGEILTPPTRISELLDYYSYPFHACSPSLACKGSQAHIVWQQIVDSPSKQWEIFYSNTIEIEQVTESDGYNSWYSDIAVDEDGNCYVVWQDGRDGNWQVYGKGYLPGECEYVGVDDARLSDSPGNNICPRVMVINSAGLWPQVDHTVTHVTWMSDVSGDWNVYYEMSYNYFWQIECSQQGEKFAFEDYFTENDVRVTSSSSPDGWPTVAVKENDPEGYPDLKFQRLSDYGDWEIYNTDWSWDEFINVVLVSGADSTKYPLFQTDPSDYDATDGVHYKFSLVLIGGSYAYFIEAQNRLGTYVSTPLTPFPSPYSSYKGGVQTRARQRELSFSSWACPNPLSSSADIHFVLPVESQVRLEIYNLAGQLVETLVNGPMSPGCHTVSWKPENVRSGIYFYRLKAGDKVSTQRMTLLK